MHDAIVDLVAWIVVYPLLLFFALLIARACYRAHMRREHERERAAALARIDENTRKINEHMRR